MKALDRILVAIDTPDLEKAKALITSLKGSVGGIKLGLEFFNAHGPQGVRYATDGMPFFLDMKYHDIPNTVAGAVRASTPLAPAILNVHASGGKAMMQAAMSACMEAAGAHSIDRPVLIAVTVLTSMDDDDLSQVGQTGPAREQVVRLASLTREAGLDGVVCSAHEIEAIRAECGPDFKLIVPGIRPAWAASGDQKRIMTPSEAISKGADYLVIGRPITGAEDPVAAAAKIAKEVEGL